MTAEDDDRLESVSVFFVTLCFKLPSILTGQVETQAQKLVFLFDIDSAYRLLLRVGSSC